ncbi:hypothetical protein B0A48_02043 [Cryoendolithus antarcticus]|uniref:WD40 repeat-like protein n=1 Tax=Cryoendolithus antarcticus TaxID=1507870 RepID=A0A1V8TMV3_9PEZI|nr:hypothetical protein B0A48_02043 [Cryoendolithus antarcticus]
MPSLPRNSVQVRQHVGTEDHFDFPLDQHLLVTTPSRVLSLDASGIQTLFKSSRSGIAAATESKDGSGILAGLTAKEDEVRHLSYTADSKKLYLSTKVTNAVQCYSAEGQRLLSPPEVLSSSPVVLAVSPDGGLMVTAERDPPVLHLKDLRGTKPSTMVVLQSSGTGVAIAAFHSERTEVFLIGFMDGALAVFDASRLIDVANDGVYVDQKRVGKAELGRISNLHKSTTSKSGSRDKSITGAAFLPAHALQVASVGADGRCRLSDFSGKPIVLWTWHCQVPLTCVATSHATQSGAQASLHSRISSVHLTEPATSLIAVGNEHGTVELYTSLGSLKQRIQVRRKAERIISAEWVAGPSPGISARVVPRGANMALGIPSVSVRPQRTQTDQHDGSTDPPHLGVHPALRPAAKLRPPDVLPGIRKFTFQPDEVDETSTVRRAMPRSGTLIAPLPIAADLDLFLTASPHQPIGQASRNSRFRSAPMSRPRVSTSTFAKRTAPTSRKKPTISWPMDMEPLVGQSHATSSASSTGRQKGSHRLQSRHVSLALRARPRTDRGSDRKDPLPRSTSALASTKKPEVGQDATTRPLPRPIRDSGHIREARAEHRDITQPRAAPKPLTMPQQPVLSSRKPPIESRVHGRGGKWVIDSVSEDSWSALHENDLWLTSEDEQAHSTARQHHLFRRSPAKQTSRSRGGPEDGGLAMPPGQSTLPQVNAQSSPPIPLRAKTRRIKPFAPDSDHVRSLFPRSSSLGRSRNTQGKSGKPHGSTKQQPAPHTVPTAAPEFNTISEPRVHGSRVKATAGDGVEPRNALGLPLEARGCCAQPAARIRALEGQLSALKLELVAIKPALRSHAVVGRHFSKQYLRFVREGKMRRS